MNRLATMSLAVLVVVTAVGTGYAWALHEGHVKIQEKAEKIRTSLGPNGAFSYASSAVHLFQRSADLFHVALRTPSGALFTADQIMVVVGGNGTFPTVHARGFSFAGSADQGSLTVADVNVRDMSLSVAMPGTAVAIHPASLTFANMTLHDVAFTSPGRSAKLASLEVQDFGVGHPSTLSASAFLASVAIVAQIDRVGFSSLKMSGLDLASAMNAVENGAKMPPLSKGSVHFDLDGIYTAADSAKHLLIQKASLSVTPGAADAPSSADLEMTGISWDPISPAPKARLEAVGLKVLNGRLSSRAVYRHADGVLEVSPAIALKGLGALTFGLTIAHLDQSQIATDAPVLPALLLMAQTAQIASAQADFTDGGLLDRLLAIGARRTGKPTATFRTQLAALIAQNPILKALPDGAQLQTSLASFVATGGKIGITMQPPGPMSILGLIEAKQSAPATTVSLLGLSVRHGQAPEPSGVLKE